MTLGTERLFHHEFQVSSDLERGVYDRKKLLSQLSLGANQPRGLVVRVSDY